jgi:hypothetical protein
MADTEAARTDMRFAQKYLEHKEFDEAMNYTASARRKDPNVTLAVKTESKEVVILTPDSLEAGILEQQAISYGEQIQSVMVEKDKFLKENLKAIDRREERIRKLDDDPEADLVEEYNRLSVERKYEDQVSSQRFEEFHGRIDYLTGEITKCLEQAIKLNPQVPNFYALLGSNYLDQKNIVGAVELLTPAQQKWPEHFGIRRALDSALKEQQLQQSQETAPTTYHPAPSAPILTRTRVFLVSILLGFLCLFIIASQGTSANGSTLLIVGAACVACFFIAFLTRPRLRAE